MERLSWLDLGDYFGVLVFAVSGALAAGRRSMDIFGVLVIGFVTALGGGTLRDILLGTHPVSWITHPIYLLLVAIAVFATLLLVRVSHRFDQRLMIISDAFGLAVFTVIGVQAALKESIVSIPVAVMMGVISGVAGGVIRDVVCNDIPLVLKREIYATASAAGGIVYCILYYLEIVVAACALVSFLVVLIIRLMAVKSQWALPSFSVSK